MLSKGHRVRTPKGYGFVVEDKAGCVTVRLSDGIDRKTGKYSRDHIELRNFRHDQIESAVSGHIIIQPNMVG